MLGRSPARARSIRVRAILSLSSVSARRAVHRAVEDVGEAHFQLPDGQAVAEAGRTVSCGERPGQPLDPAVEEPLHIVRTQRITDRLEPLWLLTGEKAIVQALEADALPPQVLLDPFMAVQTDQNGIRQVVPTLRKAGPQAGSWM